MDEDKIPLPPWLPWAATACLAAMLACVGELWLVERARGHLLRDQVLLSESALKAKDNQLEAERILGKRELGEARSATRGAGFGVELLAPPQDPRPTGVWGAVVWSADGDHALLRLSGLPAAKPGRSYQLWLDGPGQDFPVSCGLLGPATPENEGGFPVALPSPLEPGCRFLLFECASEGSKTLESARSGGSIILASLPYTGSIPRR